VIGVVVAAVAALGLVFASRLILSARTT